MALTPTRFGWEVNLKFTTLKLGVSRLPLALLSLWKAFTWYIFLAPINSASPFFLPANDLRSYLGLRAVELGMVFIILCYFVYVFVMSETLHGILCWRTSWCFPLFFRFVQWLTYPFLGGQQAQWATAARGQNEPTKERSDSPCSRTVFDRGQSLPERWETPTEDTGSINTTQTQRRTWNL